MKPEYQQVRFVVEQSDETPARFGIVTACNPDGIDTDQAQNLFATERLQQQLLDEGFTFFNVTGCSRDLQHREPGFGVVSENADRIVALGRAWRQEAVFWVQNGSVHLVPCKDGGESIPIGRWSSLAEIIYDPPLEGDGAPDPAPRLTAGQIAAKASVLRRMDAFVTPFTRLVAKPFSDKEGEPVGTATLIQLRDAVFLVTAEHVAREARGSNGLGITYSDRPGEKYNHFKHQLEFDVELDLAAGFLGRIKSCPPEVCPESHIAVTATERPLRSLFLRGYPQGDSRFLTIANTLYERPFSMSAVQVRPSWPKFDSKFHLAIGFDPRFARDLDGKPFHLPSAHGLSGGALWDARHNVQEGTWVESSIRMVGVLHRSNEQNRALIATKIEHVRAFILDRFSSLWRKGEFSASG